MIVTLQGHVETVKKLLQWGADINHPAVGRSDRENAPRLTALHLSQKAKWNIEMLRFLLLFGADLRTEPKNLRDPLEYVLDLKRLEHIKDDRIDQTIIHILYAAGAIMSRKVAGNTEGYGHLIPQFILDDQAPLLALTGLCRRQIRGYLLNPAGGNRNNLFTAVPRLPLPTKLKDFLLFDMDVFQENEDIMHCSFMQQNLS